MERQDFAGEFQVRAGVPGSRERGVSRGRRGAQPGVHERPGRLEVCDPGPPVRFEPDQALVVDIGRPVVGGHQDALLGPFEPFRSGLGLVAFGPPLPLGFECLDDIHAQPGPHGCIAHRLLDEIGAQGAGSGTFRGIVRVHVAAQLVEGDHGRERAGRVDVDARKVDGAVAQFAEQHPQGRQVELVHQAGPPGFQEYGEVPVLLRCRHQLLRLHSAHPQRQPLIESLPREQQRAAGAFPEPGAEVTGAFQRLAQQGIEVLRSDHVQKRIRVQVLLQLHDDGVVVGVHVRDGIEAVAPGRVQGQCPGAVHGAAPEGMDHQLPRRIRSPVTARARAHEFKQEVAAVRQRGVRGLALAQQIADEFPGGNGVEPGFFHEPSLEPAFPAGGQRLFGAFQIFGNAAGEMEAAIETLGPPERQGRGPGPRCPHQHLVVRDAQDLPVLRAQVEGLAHRRFPDELLVQLADQGAGIGVAQLIVAAVGNRPAGVVQGEQGAPVGPHRPVDAVVGDARLEFPHAGAA